MSNSLTLTYVCTDDAYSTYVDVHGDHVYLQHGTTRRRLLPLDELRLDVIYSQFRQNLRWGYDGLEEFREELRNYTIADDDELEELRICADCYGVSNYDYSTSVDSGDRTVCDSCISNYYWCNDCEEYFRDTTTIGDVEICEDCRDRSYFYCAECDVYYRPDDDYASDHDHAGDCCESPAQQFTMRNDGNAPLANDERATITLPAGVISAEGIGAIVTYLREFAYALDDLELRDSYMQLSWNLDTLGDSWQTREGNYTKRLSRHAYKSYAIKLAPEVVSRVGCIASDHSRSVDVAIELTRDLNMSAEEFGHAESCYWQSYSASRCTLKSNGGLGLRTFETTNYGDTVSGRSWIIPLRKTSTRESFDVSVNNGSLVPTFDTLTPDAFIVFNGYGDLGGYAAARIVAHMAGMTYRKVTFSAGVVYVNNSAGYLVAPEAIADEFTDGELCLSVDQHSNLYNDENRSMAHV